VAERADLIEKICGGHRELSADGRYSFKLFFDGDWREVVVDDYLPTQGHGNRLPDSARREGGAVRGGLAYSKARHNQLWVPLLEKAYAKAHGSYDAIVGGWIREAMLDLTGYPCECLDFWRRGFDSELAWAQLMSFKELRYPMGAATSVSGEGIIGGHAYSVLEVIEVPAYLLGQQMSIKSFQGELVACDDNGPGTEKMSASPDDVVSEGGVLRLLRVRNPWSKSEWNGSLSKRSELWSGRLRKELNRGADMAGTFWISYGDMLRRFEHIDVCKAQMGWSDCTIEDRTKAQSGDVLCRSVFRAELVQPSTEVSAFLLQRTKRGKASSVSDRQYWYHSLGLLVFGPYAHTHANSTSSWHLAGAVFSGARRDTPAVNLILSAGIYLFVPVSLDSAASIRSRGVQPFAFRLCSSTTVDVEVLDSTAAMQKYFAGSPHPLHLCLSVTTDASNSGDAGAPAMWKQRSSGSMASLRAVRGVVYGGKDDDCFCLVVYNPTPIIQSISVTLESGVFQAISSSRAQARREDCSGIGGDLNLVTLDVMVHPQSSQLVALFVYESRLVRSGTRTSAPGEQCPVQIISIEKVSSDSLSSSSSSSSSLTAIDLTSASGLFDPFPFSS